MANWITPIYDRTESDVSYAKEQLKRYRLDPTVPIVDLKGCYNISDINRVENNSEFLKDLLNSKGYQISIFVKTDWAYSDTPIKRELDRIIYNVNAIHKAFPITDFVILPTTIRTYEQANAIEKALAKLYFYVDYIINHYCNTFNSGSNFFLPIGGLNVWVADYHRMETI